VVPGAVRPLEDPLQPTAAIASATSRTSDAIIHAFRALPDSMFFRLAPQTKPTSPRPANVAGIMYPAGGTYVVPTEMVSCEVAVVPPGVIVAGLKAHVTPVGCPVQERLIAVLNPPEAVDEMFKFVEPPRATVAEGTDSCREKSFPADAVGTSLANNPCVWVAPPAVKYIVFGSPVPPAPNTMSHNPAFVIT
jgi:hypothetical protein